MHNRLKYILAILNSKLGKRLVKNYTVQLQQRQFRMLNQYVVNFPIPKNNDYLDFSKKVDEILWKKDKNEDTTTLEKDIENKVFELYNLTDEEIEFIEAQ